MRFFTINNKVLFTVLLFVMVIASAGMAEVNVKDRGPVHVTADELVANEGTKTIVFSGNAIAKQSDVTIYGQRLIIEYSGEPREIDQVVAEGDVRIEQLEKVATGDQAIFYRREGRIVLTGDPKVVEGENFVAGKEITIFLDDQKSIVKGGEGGRVNAVLTPTSEKTP
jgi:lipopolysaccharide export system protein LptA